MTKLKVKFPGLEIIKTIIGPKELNCILGVSVGQSYHEGEKLDAIIEGINENFSKCYIEIGDSLQRYNNLMLGYSEKRAYQEAILTGQTWEKNNIEIIEKLKIPYEIHFWDKWISLYEFKKALETVQNLYSTDPEYKDALDVAISQIFIIKKNSASCIVPKKEAEELIQKYLEEELAVVLLWEKKIGHSVFVYPNSSGKAPQSACECYKKLIASISQEFKLHIGDIQFFTINKQPNKKTAKKVIELPSSNKRTDDPLTENSTVNYNFNFFQSSNNMIPVTTHSMAGTNLFSPTKKELISTIFQTAAITLFKTNTDLEKEKLESFTAHLIYNISTLSNNTMSKNIPRNEIKRLSI